MNDTNKYKGIFTHLDIVSDNIVKNFTLLTISNLTHKIAQSEMLKDYVIGDAGHITKLKRVHPDVILALPVIAAELMAMALNDEDIKTDYFLKQLTKLKKF